MTDVTQGNIAANTLYPIEPAPGDEERAREEGHEGEPRLIQNDGGRAARPVRVVGIGGSLRANSTSLAALNFALRAVRDEGAEVELFDVRTIGLPFYDADEVPPEAAVRLAESVYAADGLIWSSPMYHGTISGAFKNALDWLQLLNKHEPPFLSDKAVGLIATAGGVQGLQAINTMEFVVRSLRGYAVPLVVPIARARQAFDGQGSPREVQLSTQLRALAVEVVRAARRLRQPLTAGAG